MTSARWKSILRSWGGIITLTTAISAASWLVLVYAHSLRVTPVEKALIDSLKEKAKTDVEVQKTLQPEMDRQHESLVRRRNAYSRGGLVLLISIGIFLAWFKWFRPEPNEWVGIPPSLAGFFEINSETDGIRIHLGQTNAAIRNDQSAPPSNAVPVSRSGIGGPEFAPDTAISAPVVPEPGDTPESFDPSVVDTIVQTAGRGPEAVIPILQAIQAEYRYLPDDALRRACEISRITPAQIAGVATFYGQFRHKPVGEHIIRVCEGTACHVSGSVEVGNELRRCLGIADGFDTDPARRFTIERVACIGSCSIAPVITVDDKIYGKLSALSAGKALRDFLDAEKSGPAAGKPRGNGHQGKRGEGERARVEIRVGLGSCGIASGARKVQAALEEGATLLGDGVMIKTVGCSGLCHREPLVEVIDGHRRILYGGVEPRDARKILRRHAQPRGFVRKIREEIRDAHTRLLDDEAWIPITGREIDAAPYMKKQVRVVLENCGQVDPLSLDDYRERHGMRALEECLQHFSPDDVIAKVRDAGLRGRGGAGFPTALKWEITRRAEDAVKFIICNGDEGDPGAFMDRAVLEADPFRVIEGMAIAAYAVGASEGFVYVRREYPIAVRHVRAAIARAEEAGFLGTNILGSSFSIRLHVREGAGAFVCGEETALIQSIEGKRGMPRPRPPYPAKSGLWGKPTLINNVETLACLPWILRRGPEAFASMGTEKSKGTKVFSLAGKVNRGGLIEVPMGITIREIVEDIGGGIKGGRKFKAVLAGGPSGGCIPARLADTRIDYEELASTGSIMGSGGLVVLDDRDCAVEIARYFLRFTQNESCGKCTFCRVGTKRMLEILERICEGKGNERDLATLEDLSIQVKRASLCGLGQTAPNPVLTTLRYFREEYEAHVRERRCPAAACKALIHYRVLATCTGCTLCAQACPAGAIQARPYVRHEVADDLCTRCGKCVTACPENAIEVS